MEEKIKKLKEKLQNIGTRDLLGMIGIHFITFANNAKDIAEQADIFNKTRNEPCPCGSGKKFKKCCIGKGIYD